MKKFFKALAMLVMCLAVLSVSAFAAEEITANKDGTFPASYAEGTEGQYYALVVVSGTYADDETPAISEDTVLYIDQVTAGASGAVFEDFTPRTNDPATVYVGGSDLDDGPVIIGYINSETATPEYSVSVKVTSQSSAAATVVLTAGENTYTAAYDETAAAYVTSVPAGTYKLTVNVPGHLSYTMNALAVSEAVNKTVDLKGGDVTNDGVADYYDLVEIINHYKNETDVYDVNGDGVADYYDLVIVLNNYKATATVE